MREASRPSESLPLPVQIIGALRKLAAIVVLLGGVAMRVGNSFALDYRRQIGAGISFRRCDMADFYGRGL